MEKDPKGDCANPRRITIHIYEDRLGDHCIRIEGEDGTTLKMDKVKQRTPDDRLRRTDFSDYGTMRRVTRLLQEIEECQ